MERSVPVDPELEKGYDVRMLRDDFPQIIEGWSERSVAFREKAETRIDCEYDTGPQDKLDLFYCGLPDAPLFVFIHGGYWQRGDKSIYSFVAEPFVETGVDVALVGYQLCPHADMGSIVGQIRKALIWLWRNAGAVGISQNRINLSGHSAGGHLTGVGLAMAWRRFGDDLPADLVKAGIPISGLFQLDPLRQTTINDALGMDADVARDNSPQNMRPATDAPILVALGGAETSQFHWQSDQFVECWSEHLPLIEKHAEPGVDHFDVVNRLAQADSAIFKKVRAWLR